MKKDSPVWWNKKQCGYSSPSYVEKLMLQGLPYYRVGKKQLFSPEEVHEWMQQYRADDSRELKQLVNDTLEQVLREYQG